MQESINLAALVVGIGAVAVSLARAVPTIVWLLRAPSAAPRYRRLEVRIGDKVFRVNASEIDREDSREIERAAAAVREARSLTD